jgi:hypothetical protein
MLGLLRIHRSRLSSTRDTIESVYGCTGKQPHYFLSISLKRQDANDCGSQRPKTVKKNNINYHLSRMYPNIVGPRKRK